MCRFGFERILWTAIVREPPWNKAGTVLLLGGGGGERTVWRLMAAVASAQLMPSTESPPTATSSSPALASLINENCTGLAQNPEGGPEF